MPERVVITSSGIISSLGTTADQILEGFQQTNICFEFSRDLENRVVCPVRNFDLTSFIGRYKNKRYLNRGAAFSVSAAAEAIRQAHIPCQDLAKAGLFVGAGPHLDISSEFPDIRAGTANWDKAPALWMLKFLPNTAASVIAQIFGIHGENSTISAACAASLQAVGEAFRKIRDGYLDIALAGGGDSRLNTGGLMAYQKAGALSRENHDPGAAIRPFDTDGTGFVPGEGGAFVLLESLGHARARGAEILGQVCGYGNTLDGHGMTAPEPEGLWSESAVRAALADAGISPGDIDVISSHGTGTPLNDTREADLIHRVFGSRPAVIALKSWIGHLSAACGAAELVICLMLMPRGYLPEIRNLALPRHPSVRFLQNPRTYFPKTMLIQNFGFGGQNCALVVRPWKK